MKYISSLVYFKVPSHQWTLFINKGSVRKQPIDVSTVHIPSFLSRTITLSFYSDTAS